MFRVTMLMCVLCGMIVMGWTLLPEVVGAEPMNVSDHLNAENLDDQVARLTQQRQQSLRLLLAGLDSDEPEVQYTAAALLGFQRHSQAVRSLSDRITLEASVVPQSRERLYDRYPAVEALIRIGKPSVPVMLENLATSDDPHVRGLSARVIYYVEGPDISRMVLDKAVEAEANGERKERLKSALPLLKGGEHIMPSE